VADEILSTAFHFLSYLDNVVAGRTLCHKVPYSYRFCFFLASLISLQGLTDEIASIVYILGGPLSPGFHLLNKIRGYLLVGIADYYPPFVARFLWS